MYYLPRLCPLSRTSEASSSVLSPLNGNWEIDFRISSY
ncbi:hypothetical protein LEP1GSC191_0740 [Leptospira borgpetersenii serovar Mini str. 201000851]|uniref:Uncharacterized protein n=1 Tax=Leptospira borgpetersenii str. 200801926 TaxID=1193009 RepID=A0ABN0HV15_LEPBO|nr:hypothetical protein LEP1GSC128_4186 [Leptospira borgpetersenii str. 200801926]ENO64624.1 hypothetical protein LEP1GSC191_0740 [Leptospira borgpetersenii serovar Mini str. 201000851]